MSRGQSLLTWSAKYAEPTMMALFPARPLSLRMDPAEVLQPLASAALSWLLWQVEPSLREVLAPDPLGGSCEATFRGRPSGIC